MAAFNGGKYIAEQIESIRRQTITRWRLIIKDDRSTDDTRIIAEHYASLDKRIHLVEGEHARLGPVRNFNWVMKCGQQNIEPYIAFADQDDVWHENKLNVQFQDMVNLEEKYGKHVPLLVHSDLEVVDENMRTIHYSFARYQNIRHPETKDIRTLIVQNVVVGNTIMINRQLLDLAVPIPENAYMHDWWLVLCAAVFGGLFYNPRQLSKYRIHAHNVTGVVGYRNAINPLKLSLFKRLQKMNGIFAASLQQANALRERIKSRSADFPQIRNINEHVKVIDAFLAIREAPFFKRPFQLMKKNIRRQTRLLTILLFLQSINNGLLKKKGRSE
jgi:glycosyltransferase involved in cell wall biosynthesis